MGHSKADAHHDTATLAAVGILIAAASGYIVGVERGQDEGRVAGNNRNGGVAC